MKKNDVLEMPRIDEAAGGVIQQKYYTADEAMVFMEPRIRAMFR